MLDDNIRTQLRVYLERLERPIELVASLDEGAKSVEMRELLNDIASLSPRVTVRIDGNDARKPSFSIAPAGETPRVRFAGIPMGHEFTSLVLALLQVSGYPPKVEAATLDQIKSVRSKLRFETYVSLSCHNCPDVVQAVNLMAATNPNIEAVMIDGALFQQEVDQRHVMAVPSIYVNGEPFGQGRMTLEEIVGKVDTGAAAREAEKLSAKQTFDVLIVGGGPAGAAAAIYAARKGIRTGIIAERFGGQVLDTLAIENLASVQHTEGPRLAADLERHVREYDVDIMNLQRAQALDASTSDGFLHLTTASGATLKAKSIVLATGARWREMNVPGEKEYKAKGVCFCPHCDGPLFKGKRVAVVGGGNSGVEAAIDLAGIADHVALLEFDAKLRADAVLQAKLRSLPNVTVHLGAQTTEVVGDGQKVTALLYKDRSSGETHRAELDGIFVQIGLLPNTEWLKGTLVLTSRGEIEVDARAATTLAGVFAAGDATTIPYKQIVTAMGQGSTAALSAFDYLIRSSAPQPAQQAA